MIFRAFILAFFSIFAFVGSAHAEAIILKPRAVVELFTSQGCSSCPPADAFLKEMAQREDVLPLAYHVDYWDYIGWKDTFASADHSNFQRAYALAWGKNRIYTPQMIVNGSDDFVGSDRAKVDGHLADATLEVGMHVAYEEGAISIRVDTHESLPESTVWLVRFRQSAEVEIARGENAGRSITYAQIVTRRIPVGMWNPSEGLDVKMALHDIMGSKDDMDGNGVAIILQQDLNGLPGPILGAAALTL